MTLCFDRFFFFCVCVLRFILQPPAHGMVMESNIKTHQLKKEKIIQGKRERLARKWFKNRRSFGEFIFADTFVNKKNGSSMESWSSIELFFIQFKLTDDDRRAGPLRGH